MFKKVLVANRGEIAVRVQQTLRRMGIRTVAVYSDPDAGAPHVRVADEAHNLPGASPTDTYLDVAALLGVARRSGAEAVHPGYGFLSESPAFARACREVGLVFIGPSPEAMERLGDKLRAKEIAAVAGVPVPPSATLDLLQGDGRRERARAAAERIGLPLLVKAAAGGGGRGMRLVSGLEELDRSLEAAAREAAAAFGDGRVFLERCIYPARHVEVQVLGDGHGNVIHLNERDCSLQRRHQKVLEETPCPALTPEMRTRMGRAAVAMARAAGYSGAGTMEFLLAPDRESYFLEANTRLQVEHPITEMVTGLDLVEWQVRVAAGEPLSITQEDIRPSGHAMEARVYAEDPFNGFAPSAGRLLAWAPPSGPGLRLDSGVMAGQEVSVHYDALLAKLCAWGPDRETALGRLKQALAGFVALGFPTNISFLHGLLGHDDVLTGAYHTRTIEERLDSLTAASEDLGPIAYALAGKLALERTRLQTRALGADSARGVANPWTDAGPRRLP